MTVVLLSNYVLDKNINILNKRLRVADGEQRHAPHDRDAEVQRPGDEHAVLLPLRHVG